MAKLSSTDTDITKLLKGRLDSAIEVQEPFLNAWDAHERLFMARQATNKTQENSRIYEGSLTTNVLERAIRTTAQLPTGNFYYKGLDETDRGFLVGLMFDNHTIPNATQQHDALTKIRISGIYKHLHGLTGARVGYIVREGKLYADFRLSEIRALLLQPNRYSSRDMDWIMESSVVSVGTLKTWLDDPTGTWDKPGLRKLIERLSKGAIATSRSEARRSTVNQQLSQKPSESGDGATVDVYQCYERGKKGNNYTFVLEDIKGSRGSVSKHISVLRTSKNFMPDGSLCWAINTSIPLIDRVYGLGDFERNKTIQLGIDSGSSMGMSALAMKTLPPIAFPTQGVVESTIRLQPMAKWRTDNPEKIVAMNLAPDAIPSFQAMNGTLHSFLMNNQGSTDMQIASQQGGDQTSGKTPAAIAKQNSRQDTKDAWDVEMNESFIADLFTKLMNVQCNVITKPITFFVWGPDVERLQASGVPKSLYKVTKNGKCAQVTVAPKDIKGEYIWKMDKGSAFAKNDADEQETLKEIFQDVTSSPIAVQILQQEGTTLNLGELIERRLYAGGVKDADKIIQTMDANGQGGEMQQGQPMQPPMQDPAQMQPQDQPLAPHEVAGHIAQQPDQPDAFQMLAQHSDPQVQALAQLHAQQLHQALRSQQ